MLRISLAAAVLDGGPDSLKPTVPSLIFVALATQSVLLCLGFLTPVVSTVACVFELTSLFHAGHTDWRFTVLSSLNAAAIALLGPGAYSLDARLFGRRVIVFRRDGKPDRR
jgi:uncharacterized membrane protein YphA (DoxX/SURF4 family)